MGKQFVHEGYGPGGSAVLVTSATTSPELMAALRAAFARHGGQLGATGSVAYLFNDVGLLRFPGGDREAIAAMAFAAEAEDVVVAADGAVEVLTDPRDFPRVRAALEAFRPATAEVTRRSALTTRLGDEDAAAMSALVEELAGTAGVERVYTNAGFTRG